MNDSDELPIQQAYRYLGNGALESARVILERLLDSEPQHADALQMLGLVHALGGKPRQAATLLERASKLDPTNGALLANLARACWHSGQVAQAAAAWDRVVSLGQADAGVWSDRGTVLRSLGRREEALASLDRAIALQPHHASAWTNRGNVLHELKRYDEALACHEKAIALQPEAAGPWINKAATLERMWQFDEALACLDTALTLAPGNALAWSNRGVALRHAGKSAEALASFDRALALDAACVNAWINRGTLQHDLRQHGSALHDYAQARQIDPEQADAMTGEALARLAMGQFDTGWEQYEYRWKRDGAEARRHQHLPAWSGDQDLVGKRILLWAEQGLGDTMQFCRYALPVIQRGAEVVLEVPASLVRLLRQSLPSCQVLALGETPPACDFQIPLMSLPLAFRTSRSTIPNTIPYLRAEPQATMSGNAQMQTLAPGPGRQPHPASRQAAIEEIHPAIQFTGNAGRSMQGRRRRLRIGIACSAYAGNRQRSIPLAAFAPLQKLADLVLLQKELSDADAAFLHTVPTLVHPLAAMGDFADTAAIAAALDLIVSVDTALAHLAGALGLPVWVLLPWAADWRWQVDRDDSPWYPGMRLLRQDRPGDWDGVIAQALVLLAAQAARE